MSITLLALGRAHRSRGGKFARIADRQSTDPFRGKAAQHGLAGSSERDPGNKVGSIWVRDHLQPGGACRLGHDPGCGRFPVRSRHERAAACQILGKCREQPTVSSASGAGLPVCAQVPSFWGFDRRGARWCEALACASRSRVPVGEIPADLTQHVKPVRREPAQMNESERGRLAATATARTRREIMQPLVAH